MRNAYTEPIATNTLAFKAHVERKPPIFMRHLLTALTFTLIASASNAKPVTDAELEFSMDAPDQATVQIDKDERGRALNVVYRSPDTDESFTVSVVRANNGGFNGPLFPLFERMMDGASDSVGKRPTVPLRRLSYRGLELFVAQHQGLGPNATQTLTTVVLLQERGAWRKMVRLELVTRGTRAPSDAFILERMHALSYRPAT